ncbi:MAG: NAD(P)/FAD-dependent oxidoreductase [Saprospiraceae bacterium]
MVGQGITGTLLAHALLEKGKTVQIFDNNYFGSSSQVAAGIINPVTGRRIVKGWLIDELIPAAKTFYERLEKLLDQKFYYQKNVLRVLFSIKEENLWLEKTGDALVEKYVIESNDYGLFKNKITEGEAIGEVQYSAQIDMPLLLKKSKEYFSNKEIMNIELFDYEQVKFDNGSVSYKNIEAEKIIFCEGHQGRNNPWFGNLPFEVAKGEVLLVKIPDANFDKILKHKLFIVPLPNDLYWIGATYEWDDLDERPTEKEKQSLIKKLNKILTVPYEIIDHQAAIRPSTFDRRPFLGLHPENLCLGIVNGMGTKGASLAPYFVNQFVAFLLEEKSIIREANIERFKK